MPDSTKPRFFTVAVADTNGLLRGQKLSGRNLEGILERGIGMAPAQLALDPTDEILELPGITDENGDFHDVALQIDKSSLCEMPWEDAQDSSLYLAEFTGEASDYCPRSVLRRVLDKAAKLDLLPRYGFEQEFTLFNESSRTLAEKEFDNLEPATPYASHDLILYQSLQSGFYKAVADMCEPLGISLGKMHEEIGAGFMEACIDADTGLQPADQLVLLKNFLRVLAMRQGQSVCYMPRWSEQADSQSTHIHVSLKDGEGSSVFWSDDDANHMSERFRYFIGGLQKYLPDMMLVFAPTVNSWRRFAEGTFAPPAFSWGIENRTCGFRVVGHAPDSLRFENRLPGADTNPYLTAAATISAGIAGIEQAIDPSEPTVGNGYIPDMCVGEPIASSMQEAIDSLKSSAHAKAWLSERFVETFAATRAAQVAQFEGKDLIDERRRFFELG